MARGEQVLVWTLESQLMIFVVCSSAGRSGHFVSVLEMHAARACVSCRPNSVQESVLHLFLDETSVLLYYPPKYH